MGKPCSRGNIRSSADVARLKAEEQMTHNRISCSHEASDIVLLYIVLPEQRINKCVDRKGYGLGQRPQTGLAAGKNHSRYDVFSIARLGIMACLRAKDSS